MKKMLAIGVTIGALLFALVGCTNPTTAKPRSTATASQSARVVAKRYRVVLRADGKAIAPTRAPRAVVRMVRAANEIAGRPYRYGGGHRSFDDSGYDGSGATSYVLHAGGQVPEPRTADQLRNFGRPGPGRWVSVVGCSNGAHMIIGGMRFDAHRDPLQDEGDSGVRWRGPRAEMTGCDIRHTEGL